MNGKLHAIFAAVFLTMITANVTLLWDMNERLARLEEKMNGIGIQYDLSITALSDRISQIERGLR